MYIVHQYFEGLSWWYHILSPKNPADSERRQPVKLGPYYPSLHTDWWLVSMSINPPELVIAPKPGSLGKSTQGLSPVKCGYACCMCREIHIPNPCAGQSLHLFACEVDNQFHYDHEKNLYKPRICKASFHRLPVWHVAWTFIGHRHFLSAD